MKQPNMYRFKQFINEKVVMKKSQTFADVGKFPISVGAKNVNRAIIELAAKADKSQVTSDDDKEFRALFDLEKQIFYMWYAIDTWHMDVEKIFNVRKSIQVHFETTDKNVYVDVRDVKYYLINELSTKEANEKLTYFKKFFWKNTKWGGDKLNWPGLK